MTKGRKQQSVKQEAAAYQVRGVQPCWPRYARAEPRANCDDNGPCREDGESAKFERYRPVCAMSPSHIPIHSQYRLVRPSSYHHRPPPRYTAPCQRMTSTRTAPSRLASGWIRSTRDAIISEDAHPANPSRPTPSPCDTLPQKSKNPQRRPLIPPADRHPTQSRPASPQPVPRPPPRARP